MATASQGRVRFVWVRPPSGMGAECRRRADAMEPALLGMMSGIRGEIISYMRTNAPWQNQTGDARAGLDATANITGKGSVTLSAFHTVPYGGFLETGTSRMSAYPIIGPATQAFYPEVRKVMDILAGSG